MSSTIEVEVLGLRELSKLLAAGAANTKDEISKALRVSAITVQRAAREESPIDTGTLRSGIKVLPGSDYTIVRSSVEYSQYVHEGTGLYGPYKKKFRGKIPFLAGENGPEDKGWRWIKGSKPNPFMKRAVERSRGGINEAFQAAISNILGS